MALLYQPLDVDRYDIRVLEIHQGPPGSVIECSLRLCSLVATPTYAALSYCWGDETITADIIIDGQLRPVTINLEKALQELRRIGVTHIWADAVCINQDDRQEKSNQIRSMKQIYSRATKTYAWLGPSGHDRAHEALRFLSERSKLNQSNDPTSCACRGDQHDYPCPRHERELDYAALIDLFDRDYWRRRWIIQEIAVATQVEVVCARSYLPFDELEKAILLCRSSSYWQARHDAASIFLRSIFEFRRSYRAGDSHNLCDMLSATLNFQSKDIRDKVLALSGICSDGSQLVPMPTYYQTPAGLATDITRGLIRKHSCLDIVLIPGLQESTDATLPTWCPDWLASNAVMGLDIIQNQSAWWDQSLSSYSQDGSSSKLQVQGVVLGTVSQTSSRLEKGPTLDSCNRQSPSISIRSTPQRYYGGLSKVSEALRFCLTARASRQYLPAESPDHGLHGLFTANDHLAWGVKGNFSTRKYASLDEAEAIDIASRTYRQWMVNNSTFLIGARSLNFWLAHRKILSWAFDSWTGIWLLTSLWLAIFAIPYIVISQKVADGTAIGYGVMTIVLALVYSPTILWALYRCVSEMAKSRKRMLLSMSEACSTPRRLVTTDTGAIGIACANVMVGDKICLLAGCTRAAVLQRRDGTEGGKQQYQVVGPAYVHLSSSDIKKYQALVLDISEKDREAGGYMRLIDEYRREPWWEEFELI